jgi:hypothetical protein
MEFILNRQWMALPAVCAQVPELPPSAATTPAHARVGYGAVVAGPASGAALVRLVRPQVQVQGTSVFAAKTSVIEMDPVGGVRGIPPRGWPV